MIIEYRKGNILAQTEFPIAQGVNCQGVMGSGIAKSIRDKYPDIFNAYQEFISTYLADADNRALLLGKVNMFTHSTLTENVIIFNCFTQLHYGRDPHVRYVSYDAIDRCFYELNQTLPLIGVHTLAIPKIGSNLGNGSWDVISAIINKATPALNIIVYEL